MIYKTDLIGRIKKIHLQVGHLSANLFLSSEKNKLNNVIAILNTINAYLEKVAREVDRMDLQNASPPETTLDKV